MIVHRGDELWRSFGDNFEGRDGGLFFITDERDDNSDQDPATCNNCSQPSIWGDRAMCRDGSTCFITTFRCNDIIMYIDDNVNYDNYYIRKLILTCIYFINNI